MIRTLIFAALALAACAEGGRAERCDMSVSREIAFSHADAKDRITAQAMGASCDKAIGLITIHDADGFPLWSWTTPLSRAFGDVFPADEPDHMRIFLEGWAEPAIASTQGAPGWSDLTPGQTTLDQLTYEDIRARNLPMLCHFSGTGRQTCVFWEPAAGGAGHFLDRDVEETSE